MTVSTPAGVTLEPWRWCRNCVMWLRGSECPFCDGRLRDDPDEDEPPARDGRPAV